jgi:hypothetical protein
MCGRSFAQGIPGKSIIASIPTCCNCKLVDGQESQPTNYRGCRHSMEERRKRKSQRASKTTTGRVFFSSHARPGQSFAAVLRSNTQQQQQHQQPSVAQACPATVGEINISLPWSTTNKYQVSQFSLLMKIVRLWTTCPQQSQHYFRRSKQSSTGRKENNCNHKNLFKTHEPK